LTERHVVEDAAAAPRLPPLRRVLRSFGYACRGLTTIATTQPNFVVHLLAAVVALAVGALLRVSPVEFSVIVLTIAVVLTAEALNTALETVCDLVQPTYHPLVRRAKDASAAAVLVAAIASVLVAALIYLPHLR
jgi:diacylglycerol kinase (ATP)